MLEETILVATADSNFPSAVTRVVSCCNGGNECSEEDERELHDEIIGFC